jgi:hypothetical protein
MLKFRMSAKKNPRTFEVYNSDRESVKFANCVEIPDEYEMEIMSAKKKKNPKTFEVYNSDRESVKFANCVEIPDEYEM